MSVQQSVDGYLAGLPPAPRVALTELRRTIREAAPEATETISYGMPTFKVNGRLLLSYAGFKEHCSLFPASKHMIALYPDELAPYMSGKATLRFHPDSPLPAVLVRKIVAARLEESAARRR